MSQRKLAPSRSRTTFVLPRRSRRPVLARSCAGSLRRSRPERKLRAIQPLLKISASSPNLARVKNSAFALLLALAGVCGCREKKQAQAQPHPEQWFVDATERSGLNFVHQSGAVGKYLMFEQIGSGAALFDYDNDNRLDIYLIQNGGRATNQLFHQEPNGTFRNVSAGSGVDVSGSGMGAAAGDANNDGKVDLLVTEHGRVRLFMNLGNGRFTNAVSFDNPRWATSAAFFDYDLDGWLDVVVANYLDFDPTHECYDALGKPEYCGPTDVPGTVTKLFRNRGGKAFEDVTASSGLAQFPGPGLGVVW